MFSLNTFVFIGRVQIRLFARYVAQEKLDLIRSIGLDASGAWEIDVSARRAGADFSEMQLLPSLETIHVMGGLGRRYWNSVGLSLRQATGRMALEVIFHV